MILTAKQFKTILLDIVDKIEAEQHYLSELDRNLGDGDHGVTMSIGWWAIKDKLNDLEEENDLGTIFTSISMAFLNAVGASVGPLYGKAFLRGAMAVKGKTELNREDIVDFWSSAVEGIIDMGKARVGDKTMVDTWVPIVNSLKNSLCSGEEWSATLDKAVTAGEQGMLSTKEILSQKGRSSRLGERSLGFIDPGAASAYIIFAAFAKSCKKLMA